MSKIINLALRQKQNTEIGFSIPSEDVGKDNLKEIYGDRTFYVADDGSGDFTSVKSACDYVSTLPVTTTATTVYQPTTIIFVKPAVYTEDPFTVPVGCALIGLTQEGYSFEENLWPKIILRVTTGTGVTIPSGSIMANLYFINDGYTITGVVKGIEIVASQFTGYYANLMNVTVTLQVATGNYNLYGVYLDDAQFVKLYNVSAKLTSAVTGANYCAAFYAALHTSGSYTFALIEDSYLYASRGGGSSVCASVYNADVSNSNNITILNSILDTDGSSNQYQIYGVTGSKTDWRNPQIWDYQYNKIGGTGTVTVRHINGGLDYRAYDTSFPPTSGELNTALGLPSNQYAGYHVILNDANSAPSGMYLVTTDKVNWYYTRLTKTL